MKPENHQALAEYLIALADDELVLGHRDSEWTGHAPILEEDIALANIALDEIGHAKLWYELAADLLGEDATRFPDQQVYFRPAAEFRSLQLVELPKGDWAFSMLRQYLFDSFEALRLNGLAESSYRPLAEVAGRIRNEEQYHLRHTRAWVPRLAQGTDESRQRMQAALDALWPYAQALGAPLPGEVELPEGIVPSAKGLFVPWAAEAFRFLSECGLQVPEAVVGGQADRQRHAGGFDEMVAELQQVARLDPEAQW